MAAGGTCGNVSVILSRFGLPTTVLAEFGTDPRGALLRRDLTEHGVDSSALATREDRPTGAVVEIVDPELPGGHGFVFRCPECGGNLRWSNLISRTQVRELLQRASEFSVFFFDRATAAIAAVAHAARLARAVVMFEPNSIRPGSREERAATVSDIVKYSHESARPDLAGWTPPEGSRCRLVIETLGGDGLRYRRRLADSTWSSWETMRSIVAAKVVDTSGAGDWCTAGIIYKLATGSSAAPWDWDRIEEALEFGQALAAVSVNFVGPRGVLNRANAAELKFIACRAAKSGVVSSCAVQDLESRPVPARAANRFGLCPLCASASTAGVERRKRVPRDAASATIPRGGMSPA